MSAVEAEVAATAGSPVKKVENADTAEAAKEKVEENGHGKNGDAASPQKEKDDLKTALQKLAAGKRDLLVQDPNSSVENLAEACELLGKVYGETAKECGEAYFYYGKALLELARMEAGVIDNVLDGDESEENSEEDEEEEAEDGEEAKENEAEESAEDGEGAGPSKEGESEEAENVKDNESIGSNEAGTSEVKDNTDQNAIEKEEEEDPSNLQLSWEMLELAKGIYTKHADSLEAKSEVRMELESKLSETYQTLGEVSIENENYPQAVEDLTMCLRRRQDLMPEDSRVIAETHYQLGVALGFNAQFDEAVNALSDAIAVLEKRIGLLKENKASVEPAKAKDAFYSSEKEIKEIEGLIPEIKEKIADTKDMQQETIKKIGDRRLVEDMMAQAAAKASSESANNIEVSSSSSSQKTTNILAVKKRKTEDEPATNGDAKKPHLENGAASSSTSASGDAVTNGH